MGYLGVALVAHVLLVTGKTRYHPPSEQVALIMARLVHCYLCLSANWREKKEGPKWREEEEEEGLHGVHKRRRRDKHPKI
jgi:hypothetical protein